MITVHGMKKVTDGGEPYDFELIGLSTDTKPSTINGYDIGVNSYFLEADTGDFYYLKQQGSESTTREDILSLTSVVCDNRFINIFYGGVDNIFFDNLVVSVSFDGTKYTLNRTAYWQDGDIHSRYGEWNGDNPVFDTYPFAIENVSGYHKAMTVYVPAEGTHTVEVYTEETVVVPTVWEKIGGSGSPSGELLVEINIDEWFDDTPPDSIYYEYTTDIDLPDNITVDWNGTSYQCTNIWTDNTEKWFGAPFINGQGYDFSEYPFALFYSYDPESDDLIYYIYAESSDTPVTVKIYG